MNAALFVAEDVSDVSMEVCLEGALENLELAVEELKVNDFVVMDVLLSNKAAKLMTSILLQVGQSGLSRFYKRMLPPIATNTSSTVTCSPLYGTTCLKAIFSWPILTTDLGMKFFSILPGRWQNQSPKIRSMRSKNITLSQWI